MLDLDSWIAFDEEVLTGAWFHQKLNGASIAIVRPRNQCDGIGENSGPQLRFEIGRGRNFDDLLVTNLDRAVTFEEMNHVAGVVGHDLDLDMSWINDQTFEEYRPVTKGPQGFALAAFECGRQFVGSCDRSYAATATSRSRLEHDWVTDGFGCGDRIVGRRDRCRSTRHDRDVEPSCQLAGMDLIAEEFESLGRRADKRHTSLGAASSKLGVLCEEAITGMDRVATRIHPRLDNRIDIQVRSDRI